MLKALDEKEQKLNSEKAREKEENEKYLQYIRDKDAQETEIKVKKAEINAAKSFFFKCLIKLTIYFFFKKKGEIVHEIKGGRGTKKKRERAN